MIQGYNLTKKLTVRKVKVALGLWHKEYFKYCFIINIITLEFR